MEKNSINVVKEIMMDFSSFTGLKPESEHPKRYLWTDAFAVCNFLELFVKTGNEDYLNLALLLVDQVHHILGKHREDDSRSGWISGLNDHEAEKHPTIGGLRIGKRLNERKPNEPIDQRLEWDQDGQYYHYLTKWMHALNRVSQITEDSKYLKWAIELANTAHKSFTYLPLDRDRKIMYWKMSIDLTHPQVLSMGQHDPLDGFITYNELKIVAEDLKKPNFPKLDVEISEMADICRGMNLVTNDPLGIGGLLFDSSRTAQLISKGNLKYNNLLKVILNSALIGMGSFLKGNSLGLPPDYRLAFRELGLSLGLKAVNYLKKWFNDDKITNNHINEIITSLINYSSLANKIEDFWINGKNRQSRSWAEHREINMVMLATSLAPNQFISI